MVNLDVLFWLCLFDAISAWKQAVEIIKAAVFGVDYDNMLNVS
jgi:hypothetical protein